jgi:hypothetical protein
MAKGYLDHLAEACHAAGHFLVADALGFPTDEPITADWCPRLKWEQYAEAEQRNRLLDCVQVYLAGMVAEFMRLDLDGDERHLKRDHDERIRKDLDAATAVLQSGWTTEAIVRWLSEKEQEAGKVIQSQWGAVHRLAEHLLGGEEISADDAAELIQPPKGAIQAARQVAGMIGFPTSYTLIAKAWLNSGPEAVKEAIEQDDYLQPLISAAPDADLPSVLGPACCLMVNGSADQLSVLQHDVFDSLGKVAHLTLPYGANWRPFVDAHEQAFTLLGNVRDAARRAESELLDFGLAFDEESKRVKQAEASNRPRFWFNELVGQLYVYLRPNYSDEWGDDLRNTTQIRENISKRLRHVFTPDMIDPRTKRPIHYAVKNWITKVKSATEKAT